MILHVRVTQETMEITYPRDTLIPTDILKVIREISHDRLTAFRETIHETQVDLETFLPIVFRTHAHQVDFSFEKTSTFE